VRGGSSLSFIAKFLGLTLLGVHPCLPAKEVARRIFYDRLVGVVVFFSTLAGNPLGDYTFVEAGRGWVVVFSALTKLLWRGCPV